MTQVVTRLDDKLVAELDGLVADGVVTNRSEAVRLGLERLIEEHRRQRVGAEIVDAYRRQPQTEEELAGHADRHEAVPVALGLHDRHDLSRADDLFDTRHIRGDSA